MRNISQTVVSNRRSSETIPLKGREQLTLGVDGDETDEADADNLDHVITSFYDSFYKYYNGSDNDKGETKTNWKIEFFEQAKPFYDLLCQNSNIDMLLTGPNRLSTFELKKLSMHICIFTSDGGFLYKPGMLDAGDPHIFSRPSPALEVEFHKIALKYYQDNYFSLYFIENEYANLIHECQTQTSKEMRDNAVEYIKHYQFYRDKIDLLLKDGNNKLENLTECYPPNSNIEKHWSADHICSSHLKLKESVKMDLMLIDVLKPICENCVIL